MGLKPREVRELNYKDFSFLLQGYQTRQEKEWNQTRHIMAFILNYGGMGATQFYSPQSIWPLAIDEENKKKMITNMRMAMKLYAEFID